MKSVKSVSYGVTGMRTDPRPLSDRQYMQACMKSLICYLTEHHYDHPVSLKTLSSPSAKDFQSIFTFLIRRLDPHFQWTSKFEDEVPVLLKRLKYPFNVSKSALYAVGSPHTWPTLLGCLAWLVELLIFDVEHSAIKTRQMKRIMFSVGILDGAADPEAETTADDEASIELKARADEEVFFEYVSATYSSFLAGSDDFEEFDNELEGVFSSRNSAATSRSRDLELQMQNLENQLQRAQLAVSENESRISDLSQRREDYLSDIEKFRKLIAQLTAHKSMLEKKLAEREEEVQEKAREVTSLIEQLKGLKDKMEAQQNLSIDVERISRRRRELRAALDRAQQKREEEEARRKELLCDKETLQGKIDELLRRIHALVERVGVQETRTLNGVLPSTIDKNISSADAQKIHSTIQDALREHMQQVTENLERLNSEVLELQDAIRMVEEKILLQRENNRVLTAKLQRLENTYNAERESLAKRLADASEKNARIQEEICDLRNNIQETVANSQKAIEHARTEWRTLAASTQAEYDSANDSLLLVVERLTDHKVFIQNNLATLHRKYSSILAAVSENEIDGTVTRAGTDETSCDASPSLLEPAFQSLRLQKKAESSDIRIQQQREPEHQFDENVPPNQLMV
jgi:kinetochore protein NDC80